MLNFKDLLNKPLPSSNLTEDDLIRESYEDEYDEGADDICTDNCDDDCEDCNPAIDDDDTTSAEDDLADEVDPTDPTDAFMADDLGLSDDSETQRIDDRIQRVATPVLVNAALNGEEVSKFTESCDSDIAMAEDFVTERTIVKFDKKSRYAQLRKVAILAIAKEKKHPLYKKLAICWKMEKAIEKKFEDLYGSQANARVKVYLQKARASKSKAIKKAATKVSK